MTPYPDPDPDPDLGPQWSSVLTVNSCFQSFFHEFLEVTSFYATSSGQIIPRQATDVEIWRFFFCITILLILDGLKFQEFYLNTLQTRNVGVKSVGTKVDIWEKCTLSFLKEGLSI